MIEALNKIDQSYYRISTTYDQIVRERVFCYELYHQMRLNQRNYSLGELHSEIGHEKYKAEDRKNPDFIFHTPGRMKENRVVIEVKGKVNGDIFKDLDTLNIFTKRYHYKAGYFILFGNSLSCLMDFLSEDGNIREIMKYLEMNNITIICKENEGLGAEIVRFKTLIELLKKGGTKP